MVRKNSEFARVAKLLADTLADQVRAPYNPGWLSPQEVAAELGIALTTIDGWLATGTGPPRYEIGGMVRFDRGDLTAWLERRKVVAAGLACGRQATARSGR
jgi:excisionase family DNA binding protein